MSRRVVPALVLPMVGIVAGVPVVALPGPAAAGAAQAAGVAVHQSYPLPRHGQFTVVGRGYGHGHGMSQYGAEGAARQGLGYRRILRFYYPGTRLARTEVRVRIRIDEDTTRGVLVRARPGLRVRDLGSDRVVRLPHRNRIVRWRLGVSHGRTVLSYRTRAPEKQWHRYRPPGLRKFRGDGQFRAPGPLTLLLPHGARMRVHGALRAASPEPGSADRDTVNVLGIDQYLRGVVAAEMPASWHQAALRAQAVAARTYALRERADNRRRHYDLCDTSACQVYRGIAGQHRATDRAVRATRGRYLRYRGEPAFTQFSSSSGGWTSAGGQPYLPHRRDPYDGWPGNPVHRWRQQVDVSVLERAFPGLGSPSRLVVTRREGGGRWHGRVEQLTLYGARGTRSISGDEFRSLCGLRSTWFRIR